MPQMAPMLWLILFIYFLILLLTYIVYIYYLILPLYITPNAEGSINTKKSFNWVL